MSDTPRLSLPLIEAAQAQKHVTHNEALVGLDALVNLRLLDRDLAEPAGGEADGDAYLVASPAAGAWTGEEGRIAYLIDGGWRFYAPFDGLVAYVADEMALIVHAGGVWADFATFLALQNLASVGIGTMATASQRLAVKSDEVICSHDDVTPGTGNMVVTLNKAADANDAGHAYKVGWQARALAGLFGDGDYQVKVSADGAAFTTALAIDNATGIARFPAGLAGVREALSAARTYHVNGTAGDDANDGLSAATAFATIQRAVNAVAAIDMAGQTAFISVAAGTYAESVVLKDLVGGPCVIVGDETTPGNVLVSPAAGIAFGANGINGTWSLRGVKIEGAGISRSIHANSGVIGFRNMDFGAIGAVANYYHIFAEGHALVEAQGDYTISGGAGAHWRTGDSGILKVQGKTVTFTGTPEFTNYFTIASGQSYQTIYSIIFINSAIGIRYRVDGKGFIFVNGAGGMYLPGDSVGSQVQDGYYG
ncbi:uncharacterized protein DUF2793 [Breoghania corrubedonensis]|uniref:Uncharacterized protein DUF2793 n=1 Tax=Breoghania corrubedonensis TaxID=665038 RepID=A0A2T5V1L0_9HYPH|nr:DUF2793 domain-containing protein [Breoghania corrubedonensis]PTW57645.1 uncharacterized protein DUF2793 [Breoghania corrubedonensis]